MAVRVHFWSPDIILDQGVACCQGADGERAPRGVAGSSERTNKTVAEILQQVELQEEGLMWEK
jgi:hypothetical protein